MKNSARIGVLIPVYNGQATIRKVLEAFTPAVVDELAEIVVIDNASQDGTMEQIESFLRTGSPTARKCRVIRNEKNVGYGGSQKIGYRYFLSETNCTHLITIHGDNQGDANSIACDLISRLYSTPGVDVVYASRFLRNSNISNYSWVRKLGNYFFNFMTRALTGIKMSDAGAAIFLIRLSVLKEIPFARFTDSFQFPPQLNLWLKSLPGLTIQEIPLTWKDSEAGSNVRVVSYGLHLLKILATFGLKKRILRKSLPEAI